MLFKKEKEDRMRTLTIACFLSMCLFLYAQAAPCYGTKMPAKKGFFAGAQVHSVLDRKLEHDSGKIRSAQYFVLLSYGLFDWLSVDLKGGAGNIKQRPCAGDDVNYKINFAGGYGFRLKLVDKGKIKAVFGFQHISVHPSGSEVAGIKHKAILDDWQTSLLVSCDMGKVTPYAGTRWSRVDYIHRQDSDRKRTMSDFGKSVGLIAGLDVPLSEKIWLNLEGQAFDSEAFSCSVNYKF